MTPEPLSLLSFLLAALVLAIMPGPGLAYVLARTAAGGRRAGFASCLGTALGGMVHVLAAATGLSLLLARSATAFSIMKYVGAAYLLYLGIHYLRQPVPDVAIDHAASAQPPRRVFLDGVLVEALNVKTALFFIAFLPQFVNPAGSLALQFLALGTTCVLLNSCMDVVAVLSTARLLATRAVRRVRERLMQRTAGVIMLVLGTMLACTSGRQ